MAVNHVLQDRPFRKEGRNVHYGNPTEGLIDFWLVMDDRTLRRTVRNSQQQGNSSKGKRNMSLTENFSEVPINKSHFTEAFKGLWGSTEEKACKKS